MPVQRRPTDAQDTRDVIRALAAIDHLLCLPNLRRRECRRAPDVLASCLGRAYPSDGSFAQNVTLELRDGAKARIQHFASGGGRVDVFGQRSQCDVTVVERLGDLEKVTQRASEPIELPHDESVAGAQVDECAIHLWPRAQCAAELVLEDSLATGGLKRVKLQAGRLFVG